MLAGGLALAGCAASATTTEVETVSGTTVTSTDTSTDTTVTSDTASETSTGATAETIADTAATAEAFLATLSEEQQEAVLYDYADETKSTSWSNFPVTFVDRAGLNLTDLSEEQQHTALDVLETLLSEETYATIEGVMGGDEYLNEYSSTTEDSLGQYYIAFFGDPSDTDAWALQFGGHHLGVNADLNGAEETLTFAPTHLGIQPAVYTNDDGEEVQPFDEIYTDAFAFYDSLTADQQATLTSGEVTMCSPGDTCNFTTGTGLSGSDLTDEQRELLLEVIAHWRGWPPTTNPTPQRWRRLTPRSTRP